MSELTCGACGNPLPKGKPGPARKWCSPACSAWGRRNPGKIRPTKRECGHCGVDISHREMSARYCSKPCSRYGSGRSIEPTDRDCVTCGKTFRGVTSRQRFCPPTAEQRDRGWKQSRCSRKHEKKLQRESGPQHQFDCHWCGVNFKGWPQTKENRYCSRKCVNQNTAYELVKAKSSQVHSTPCRNKACWYCRPKPMGPTCPVEQAPQRVNRRWVAGGCHECGSAFVGGWHVLWPPRFCSDRCQRRGGGESHRARARRHGVSYIQVSRVAIFKRDGYLCGICGRKTDPGAKVPDWFAPTIDHIIPMSLGGPHTAANLQCACFICNTRKGATLPTAGAVDEAPQLAMC